MFLRNTWYPAAYSEEVVHGRPLGRRLLNEPVMFFRLEDGGLAAIGDRCPHRFVPLHLGVQIGDVVRCPYHGLQFDASGGCVHNPHTPSFIPQGAKVPAYPTSEANGLIWIWMGEAERALDATVPDYDCLDATKNAIGKGYLHGEAHYELMVDNIMDLSHVEFVHPSLGTEAVSRAAVTMEQQGASIACRRRMVDEVLPPGLAGVYRTGTTPVNRTFTVTWRPPSLMELRIEIEPHDPQAPPFGTGSRVLHLFTPESETSTHYFYIGTRTYELEDTQLTERFLGALGAAFLNEDKPLIEAQQQMIGNTDLMSLHPALMPIDRAAARVRKTLSELISHEQAAPAAAE